jgi:alginate O-acetyltransferase complex protein AlgI
MLRDLFAFDSQHPLLFTSGQFFCWLTLFFPCFVWLRRARAARLLLVAGFSCFFYYKCSGVFVLALLATAAIDFRVAQLIAQSQSRTARRRWMWVSIALSGGVLVYFKYTSFVLGGISSLAGLRWEPFELLAPAGISFYTFESISYTVDVYRGRLAPTKSFVEYVAYLSYFPHLMAGPIMRAEQLLPSLREPAPLDAERLGSGLFLILSGLFKKAIVADYLARFADGVFGGAAGLSGFEILLGVYAYAGQIYCDFAGYSELALGLGRLTGVELPVNFRAPYAASSLTDFWRRWHVSLSSWLRDYVYVPLGGSRQGPLRSVVNLILTMMFGGLWHGASLAFLGWGLVHGVLLAFEKTWSRYLPPLRSRAIARLATFHLVALLWLPFRAGSFEQTLELLARMVRDLQFGHVRQVAEARGGLLLAITCALLLGATSFELVERLGQRFARAPLLVRAATTLTVVQLVLELRSADVQPFIYFQF